LSRTYFESGARSQLDEIRARANQRKKARGYSDELSLQQEFHVRVEGGLNSYSDEPCSPSAQEVADYLKSVGAPGTSIVQSMVLFEPELQAFLQKRGIDTPLLMKRSVAMGQTYTLPKEECIRVRASHRDTVFALKMRYPEHKVSPDDATATCGVAIRVWAK